MQTLLKPFLPVTQASQPYSLYSKRANNRCLLLIPSPHVLSVLAIDCVNVAFNVGDVPLNPGPQENATDHINAEILSAIKSLASTMQSRLVEVMSTLNEVKAIEKVLEERVCDITVRLAAVKNRVDTLEGLCDSGEFSRVIAETVQGQTVTTQSRLDEYEDRPRRHNLIL